MERWIPEPLVDDVPADHLALTTKLITGAVGKRIVVDGHDCLNLGSHNYLDLLGNAEIQEKAISSVRKYGVGSCGPRGFYGTIDVHLELEEKIAKFMNMEESAVYSYGFSTVASAISAYCKRSDVAFMYVPIDFYFFFQKSTTIESVIILAFTNLCVFAETNVFILQYKKDWMLRDAESSTTNTMIWTIWSKN